MGTPSPLGASLLAAIGGMDAQVRSAARATRATRPAGVPSSDNPRAASAPYPSKRWSSNPLPPLADRRRARREYLAAHDASADSDP